ncbi:hypothetical protein GUJ93_ZPchr0001g29922 [Zizania palustris]|uniref:Uncharacterized protein n=1 Tax=Zizania palustris TaxID=103762 RepID=A0A8J5V7K4_ZIZPA|nr:hypothetical protein GUJ93_ZPchr0001g29922 [Zizania palustris]
MGPIPLSGENPALGFADREQLLSRELKGSDLICYNCGSKGHHQVKIRDDLGVGTSVAKKGDKRIMGSQKRTRITVAREDISDVEVYGKSEDEDTLMDLWLKDCSLGGGSCSPPDSTDSSPYPHSETRPPLSPASPLSPTPLSPSQTLADSSSLPRTSPTGCLPLRLPPRKREQQEEQELKRRLQVEPTVAQASVINRPAPGPGLDLNELALASLTEEDDEAIARAKVVAAWWRLWDQQQVAMANKAVMTAEVRLRWWEIRRAKVSTSKIRI